MGTIRKHVALPALVLAIAVLAILGLIVYGAKDKGKFEFIDLIGSREAIRDVALVGELSDGMHSTSFRIDGGRLHTDTKLFDQARNIPAYLYYPGSVGPFGAVRFGRMEYNIENRSTEHTIYSRVMTDKGYSVPEGAAEVKPSVVYRPASASDENANFRWTNPLEYGLAQIGDRVFYTLPVTTDYTGMNAIYELKFYDWGFRPQDMKPFESRKLVELPLTANEPGGTGIEILGLKAVGDKLALLSVEAGYLHIRSFDSDSGKLLGEADLSKSDPSINWQAAYSERYEAYVDAQRALLTVSFRGVSQDAEERPHTAVLSFDFSNGIELVDWSNLSFEGNEENNYGGVSLLGYRNGRVIAVRSYREPESEQERGVFDILRPQHLYLYVFEHAKLIYKGELATDKNDDRIRAFNRVGGYDYSPTEHRNFLNVALE
ncbi:hypothetical protein [Cohnella phaseoli]|uniref:Uncharacterized protein n=1 Tax=Cohnella phaseoli TaxID=456490 RepID=A0A3D9I007_9BACL|nr:hypothetical protein [Cohnella phaseoli]RED55015.1 hypothetical protein DFP98_14523 [Cohnella phaseoli]